ncbi:hypothetical protein KK101_00525 [Curtobacterium flaccumfaciens pv. oortii]|uniref:hypothetical protein n=1 Tax=Curtobacterium flaccumfaciens TaxID=2035 RepID=UPI001BDEED21|nr:hypothetical protein [Curtobacterium flaccumfaciens]MBT1621174.1 hypothetical protein [Curtobacterium flaccumfaciens pv. oortii]
MTVVFRDVVLRRAAEDRDFCPAEWSDEVLATYRRRLQQLDAVHLESDLHQIRSLGVRVRSASEGGALTIPLGKRVVLELHVESATNGLAVRVVLDGFAVLRKEKSA